jgi:hypothetical protein
MSSSTISSSNRIAVCYPANRFRSLRRGRRSCDAARPAVELVDGSAAPMSTPRATARSRSMHSTTDRDCPKSVCGLGVLLIGSITACRRQPLLSAGVGRGSEATTRVTALITIAARWRPPAPLPVEEPERGGILARYFCLRFSTSTRPPKALPGNGPSAPVSWSYGGDGPLTPDMILFAR